MTSSTYAGSGTLLQTMQGADYFAPQVAVNDIGSEEDFLAAIDETIKYFNDGLPHERSACGLRWPGGRIRAAAQVR